MNSPCSSISPGPFCPPIHLSFPFLLCIGGGVRAHPMVCLSQAPRSVAEFGQWEAREGDRGAWEAGRDQDVPSQSLPWVALWPGSVSSMASAPARSWAQVTPPSSMTPLTPREKYFLTVAHLWVSSLSPSWLHFSGTSVLWLLLSPLSSSIRVQTFFSVSYSWVKSLLWLCILSSHCPVLCSSSW